MLITIKKVNIISVLFIVFAIYYSNLRANTFAIDSMFNSEKEVTFSPVISDAYGVSFRDINKDGLPDLYIVCFRNLNRLLIRNPNDKSFIDVTIQSGLGGNLMPGKLSNLELGTAVADFNNDNNVEVLISGWNKTTRFFTNQGDNNFKSYLYHLKIKAKHDFNDVITGDVDNDGDLDLFFTDEHYTNRLFINRGNAVFDDQTTASGVEFNGISQGAAFGDLDNDGYLDLYVTNWDNVDLLYRNKGDGTFERIYTNIKVCTDSISTNAISFADIDNDADLDLFITNRQGKNFLYQNQTIHPDSQFMFIDVSKTYGFVDSSISYGSVIADFNNDGWQDIFITNIGANQFYLNRKGKFFDKLFQERLITSKKTKGYSTGAAYADYDLDGDLDLFVANKDTFCLFYENPINNNSFITFQLNGIQSNRDAIGSKLEIYKAGHINDEKYLLGSREISGGSGYLSTNDLTVHFGLDTVQKVDAKIIFPSQKIITMFNLQNGQLYQVDEYPGIVKVFILSYKYLSLLMHDMEFWYHVLLVTLFISFTILFIRLGLHRYKWQSHTATLFLTGYFFITLLIIGVLYRINSIYILLALNFVSLLFLTVFVFFSERIKKLSLSSKRYQSVLIDLINKIIKIRDDKELINTVVHDLTNESYYNKICILLLKPNENVTSHIVNIGFKTDTARINTLLKDNNVISSIKDMKFDRSKNNEFIRLFNAEVLYPIQHESNFYGVLILGSTQANVNISDEEIDLYASLTNQMAITLENNEYIRKSNELIKNLTEAKVKEKYLKKLEISNANLDNKNKELQNLYDELKNTQSQLIQSEKMSSLGQLVAGISHELNNPIGFIYSNSNQLQKYLNRLEQIIKDAEKDSTQFIQNIQEVLPDVKGLIEDTISGSNIVKELVDNLRRFSHIDQAKKQNVDIHECIESSLKIIHSQLKDRIAVHKQYKATITIDCNPGQINQVLLNILSNAAQSIENEGNLWIDTGEENDYLFVKIKDDGQGINKENQEKIFDPFFTTKAVGEGTGLGLSISYSIINNHNGNIEVESEINKGSTFTILLPV